MEARVSYNPNKRCAKHGHEEEVAAVCPRCFDAALRQQANQHRQEQKQAHEEYLLRLAR